MSAIKGSLQADVQPLLSVKAKLKASLEADHVVVLTRMERNSVPMVMGTETFLEDCLEAFVENCPDIQNVFKQNPTRFSGDIDNGLAIVTERIKGTITVQEKSDFHMSLNAEDSQRRF